jgi:hypothetical protein
MEDHEADWATTNCLVEAGTWAELGAWKKKLPARMRRIAFMINNIFYKFRI